MCGLVSSHLCNYCYHPHPKDGEGTVFTCVCLFTGGTLVLPGDHNFAGSSPMLPGRGYPNSAGDGTPILPGVPQCYKQVPLFYWGYPNSARGTQFYWGITQILPEGPPILPRSTPILQGDNPILPCGTPNLLGKYPNSAGGTPIRGVPHFYWVFQLLPEEG